MVVKSPTPSCRKQEPWDSGGPRSRPGSAPDSLWPHPRALELSSCNCQNLQIPVNLTWVSPHEGVDSDDEFINILQVLRERWSEWICI